MQNDQLNSLGGLGGNNLGGNPKLNNLTNSAVSAVTQSQNQHQLKFSAASYASKRNYSIKKKEMKK